MILKYEGSSWLRQRLVCSTLSGTPIRIDNIRSGNNRKQHNGRNDSAQKNASAQIGLRDYEANLLRLLEKITKGTTIQISKDGTSLVYKPGVIFCGPYLTHECSLSRGIGFYLEVLMCLAPFAKQPLSISLTGITNHPHSGGDLSVDTLRNNTMFLLKKIMNGMMNPTVTDGKTDEKSVRLASKMHGIDYYPTLRVVKRGAFPKGGGEVRFECPILRGKVPAIVLTDEGMIKRFRGIAYSTRVSPQISTRMITGARSLLNSFIPDVFVYSDHYSGKQSGLSPGYAIYLQAETDTYCRLAVEYVPSSPGQNGAVSSSGSVLETPEDVGVHAAKLLCEEIKRGGCIDSSHQGFMFLFMALTPEDVSKVRVGKLSESAVNWLRHIKDFFGVTFRLAPDHDSNTVVLSCVGSGFGNINRKSS